jgi:hypothetical protein
MKLYHDGREINDNAVDYGDGTVMIQYKDDNEVAIINKSEIKTEPES